MSPDTPYLPYGRHQVDEADIAAVVAALQSDSLTGGALVGRFEQEFARRVGARYAVVCSSGTAGLHLAMLALGLRKGDQALVPSVTFLATANAARYVGAEVVFTDSNPVTGLMRMSDFESAYQRSDHAKVVLPVHLNGQCQDIERIFLSAKSKNLWVVEDACHALGATYTARDGSVVSVGSCQHSDMTVFSLHPVKTIAMGEGGVVTTNSEELYNRLCLFRSHGMVRNPSIFKELTEALGEDGKENPWYYEMQELGFNFRASEINCALGLSQLKKLDYFLTRRRLLADTYDQAIEHMSPHIRPISRVEGCQSGWHLYVVHIDFPSLGLERATVMRHLAQAGIGTQVHYLPVHRQHYYLHRYGNLTLPGADNYYAHCLTLPLFPAMEHRDIQRVVSSLSKLSQ